MHNDIVTIGSYSIHGYGLMIGLGVLFAYFDAVHRAKKSSTPIKDEYILSPLIWCVLFGLLGAKVLYWLTILDQIVRDPHVMLEDFSSGFVIYGGILGGLAALLVYSRRRGLNSLPHLDIMFPSLALAQGFGRIGCLLAGCCYGVETKSSFSIVFHNSAFAPNGVALVPTQLISSSLDFVNYFVLSALYLRNKVPGKIMAYYLLFYSTGRFFLEFFRGDLIRGSIGILSTSQFISLFVALAAVVMLVHLNHNKTGKSAQDK